MRQLAAENAASIAGDDGTGRADTGVYFFGAEKRGGGGKGRKKISRDLATMACGTIKLPEQLFKKIEKKLT